MTNTLTASHGESPGASASGRRFSPYELFGGDSPLTCVPSQVAQQVDRTPDLDTAGFTSQTYDSTSNIERIRARARQQAEQEARQLAIEPISAHTSGLSTRRGSASLRDDSGGNGAEESDSDDSIANFSVDQLMQSSRYKVDPSSSPALSSSSPASKRSKHDRTPESDSFIDEHAASSPTVVDRYQEPVSAAGRARRKTARTQPYSFKLSLQRPSSSRQAILDARHSAAVKTNLIKASEYKAGVKGLLAVKDEIGRIVREQNKNARQGTDFNTLDRTLRAMDEVQAQFSLSQTTAAAERRQETSGGLTLSQKVDDYFFGGDDDGRGIGAAEKVESKMGEVEEEDEDENRPLTPLDGDEEKYRYRELRTNFEADTGEAGIDERKAALEIIEHDRDGARAGSCLPGDLYVEERLFWKSNRAAALVRLPHISFTEPSPSKALLQSIVESDTARDRVRIVAMLNGQQIACAKGSIDAVTMTAWLVQLSMLADDEDMAHAACSALPQLLGAGDERCIKVAVATLRSCLLALGADQGILSGSDHLQGVEAVVDGIGSQAVYEDAFSLRSRACRTMGVVNALLIGFRCADFDMSELVSSLFLWQILMANDPQDLSSSFTSMELQCGLFDVLVSRTGGMENDCRLCDALAAFLDSKAATTQAALLDLLPRHTLRARILARNVAVRVLLRPQGSQGGGASTYSVLPAGFAAVLAIFEGQVTAVNPFLVRKDARPDYVQFEASVRILRHCFSDLLLQLSSLKQGALLATAAQKRGHDLLRNAGVEALLRTGGEAVDAESHGDARMELYPNDAKAGQLRRIVKRLDDVYTQINAKFGRTGGLIYQMSSANDGLLRAKDALQRLTLMLRYFLQQHNLSKPAGQSEGVPGQPRIEGFLKARRAGQAT